MDWYRKRKRKRCSQKEEEEEEESALETIQERRERWLSLYVIYFTMFLMSLGFSSILTGVYPYLDKLDPDAGKEFMGYVVGANPLAQMLFSPLVGWWGNRLGSIRLPALFSLTLFTIASAMYSVLELFPSHHKYWMLGARFIVGMSSANVAVCRSYLSAATTLKERTGAVSLISLAQVLGFIVGPALQAAVSQLGDDGIDIIPNKLTLNMYSAAGWINVFMSMINLAMFLPCIFVERPIAAREAMVTQGAESEEATWRGSKPDYISTWTLISAFFVLVFNFVLLETLGTPLTMDQFAWSKQEAVYYMGILMSVGAVIACITFLGIGPLCKRFPERKVLLWGGFFLMVIGRALYIPWGTSPPQIAVRNTDNIKNNVNEINNGSYTGNMTILNNSKEMNNILYAGNMTILNGTSQVSHHANASELGCPSVQEWCYYTPSMTISQFILGYALTAVGYPIGVTLIQTIFSKILGPRPQGVWMGLMTGSGCLSRVMGPVFVSYIYTQFGTIWTFGITTVMMAASMVWLRLVDTRLIVPEPVPEEKSVEIPLRGSTHERDDV